MKAKSIKEKTPEEIQSELRGNMKNAHPPARSGHSCKTGIVRLTDGDDLVERREGVSLKSPFPIQITWVEIKINIIIIL